MSIVQPGEPPQAVYPPHVMAELAQRSTQAGPAAPSYAAGSSTPAHDLVRPPAKRARQIAVALSIVAVTFSLGFGLCVRRAYALRAGFSLSMFWPFGEHAA